MGQTRWEQVSIPAGLTFAIDQITDNGAGAPRFRTTTAHDLVVNDVVTISGTTNGIYDGDRTVTATSDNTHFDVGALTFYGLAVVVRGVQGSVAAPHVATTDVFKLVDTTRTLYTAADISALAFAVSASAGISGGDRVTLNNEELLVDAIDAGVGGALVARGVQGSTAAVHAAGAAVSKLVDTTRTLQAAPILTVTGDVITDAIRATAAQGDGLPADSSYGMWEAITNKIENGGFETDLATWGEILGTGETETRIITDHKFGTACMQLDVPVGGDQGTQTVYAGAFPPQNAVWTASAWLKAKTAGDVGKTVQLFFGGLAGSQSIAECVLTADWKRFTTTTTFLQAIGTGWYVRVLGHVVQAVGVLIDGVQVEDSPIATPYIETDGGTAARTAPRVQAPSSLFTVAQGWVAVRANVALGDGVAGINNRPIFFEWGNAAVDDYIHIGYQAGNWEFQMRVGGNYYTSNIDWAAPAPNSDHTFIMAWTPTQVKGSHNGVAFVVTAKAENPVLAQAVIELGRPTTIGGGQGVCDSRIRWAAIGSGTLTDADAATIHGFGNTDPTAAAIPDTASAGATLVWPADTSATLLSFNAASTKLVLDDTTGISNGDSITIGNEQITVTTVADGTILSPVVRGVNSTAAIVHASGAVVNKVTDTTDTLYTAINAVITLLAFSAIAGFADGNTLLIGAERLTCTTKNATVDGFTVLARGYNSSAAAVHVISTAILKVTDTTDNVGITTTAGATTIAFDAIAGFANADVLVIGAERLTVTTKSPAESGDMLAEGIAISSAVDLVTGECIVGLELPTDWDAPADVCFQVSRDGTNYLDLMDKDGAIIRVTTIGEGEMRVLANDNRGADFPLGPNKVRVRSVAVGSAASMKQIDTPVFYLLLSKGK